MSKLILVRPAHAHIPEITAYRDECLSHDDHSHGDSGLDTATDIAKWVDFCHALTKKETIPKGTKYVQADQFMLMREGHPRILGMINLRHYLKEGYLAEHGGHIGFGIRPLERGKGYAKAMLALCLEACRKLGLTKVLLCCDIDNHGSRGTIKACGGVFERLAIAGAEIDERYWIELADIDSPPQVSDNAESPAQSHPLTFVQKFQHEVTAKASATEKPASSDIITNYYSNYDEESRLVTRPGLVEFLTTMRYLEKYMPNLDKAIKTDDSKAASATAKILEIGAGTGRYSRAIAEMGYAVEAVELVPHNIDIFRKEMTQGQQINITQGNALDLSMFAAEIFELTLLLGPLYHLYTVEEKRQAISEALRVTKPGGVVFAAYCQGDPSIVEGGFSRKRFSVADMIQRGLIDPVSFATKSRPEDIFELVRTEDITHTMSVFDNAKRLHLVGTDLFSRFIPTALDDMHDEEFSLYLRYHFAVCERADLIGASHHVLDIFKKLYTAAPHKM